MRNMRTEAFSAALAEAMVRYCHREVVGEKLGRQGFRFQDAVWSHNGTLHALYADPALVVVVVVIDTLGLFTAYIGPMDRYQAHGVNGLEAGLRGPHTEERFAELFPSWLDTMIQGSEAQTGG